MQIVSMLNTMFGFFDHLSDRNSVYKVSICEILQINLLIKEIWIYVFPEKELRSYSPNSYIYVSVSDLYFPLPILMQENRWAERGNI
jgi:hypothetical protein